MRAQRRIIESAAAEEPGTHAWTQRQAALWPGSILSTGDIFKDRSSEDADRSERGVVRLWGLGPCACVELRSADGNGPIFEVRGRWRLGDVPRRLEWRDRRRNGSLRVTPAHGVELRSTDGRGDPSLRVVGLNGASVARPADAWFSGGTA